MLKAYTQLLQELREINTLSNIGSLLRWDQETMMPTGGAHARAEALALTGRMSHERFTSERIGDLLATCESDAALCQDPAAAVNLRELRRDYDRAHKVPADLVAQMNETSSLAQVAWRQARRDNDFAAFRPWLEKQLDLVRTRAECLGTPAGGEPYDALLQDYEPGMTVAELQRIFEPLKAELTPLIAEIAAAAYRPDEAPRLVSIPVARQQAFHHWLLARIGFDLESGRLDTSAHPFSSGIAPGDTRLTSRYRADRFADGLGSTLHEAGHGLYEQGLPARDHPGQPLSQPLGMGIHESQARLWENQIGRSLAFWTWALPAARETLGATLASFTVTQVHEALNIVSPSLIRVESDEATYNLHIMLRFDLERAMLNSDLAVADLPDAWSTRMLSDLGLAVPDDTQGCLQDVHWSIGSIGYFPTYTLGNLYAAQFHEAVRAEEPDLEAQLSRGEFGALLGWLRTRIHVHGRRRPAAALCHDITGRRLSHEPLLDYLREKLSPIYRLGG